MDVNANERVEQTLLQRLRCGCAVKRFKPDSVPEATLQSLLDAGCQTASPWNLRPWQFVLVRNPEARQRVLGMCEDPGPACTAPILLVVLADPAVWKQAPERVAELVEKGLLAPGDEFVHLERIRRHWAAGGAARVLAIARCHAAVQQITLAASEVNLAACWIQDFDPPALQAVLRIPTNLLVVGVLALGYCAETVELSAAKLPRMVFSESHGLPWRGAEVETPAEPACPDPEKEGVDHSRRERCDYGRPENPQNVRG